MWDRQSGCDGARRPRMTVAGARRDIDRASIRVIETPELRRRFEAIVFDWDGTAVPDREADASSLRALVEELCAAGLHLAVVTGTHIGNVDGQLCARPSGPGRLYLCLNRGSEVFVVGEKGPQLLYRR